MEVEKRQEDFERKRQIKVTDGNVRERLEIVNAAQQVSSQRITDFFPFMQ